VNLSDRRLWEKIVVAVSCVIILSWIALFVINPEHRIVVGTCGSDSSPMNYSSDLQPTFEESYLHEFGEPEPDRNLTLPPLMRYREKQPIIDTMMTRAGITVAPDAVIGLYEFPDARILLVRPNSGMVELLETHDKIQAFNLAVVLVGNRTTGGYDSREWILTEDYNFSSENTIAIDRVDLVLPPPGNATAPLYIVNKTEVNRILYPDGRSIALITSTSTFYVRYGQRVERVIGTAEMTLDPAWKQCSPRLEISGEGSRQGGLQHTVKFARGADRILWSNLIISGADIQWSDTGDGSTSEWVSSDRTGCSC